MFVARIEFCHLDNVFLVSCSLLQRSAISYRRRSIGMSLAITFLENKGFRKTSVAVQVCTFNTLLFATLSSVYRSGPLEH